MSMVSRRVFLKCVGVGSAAVASAALLGGCSGGGSSSSGSNNNGGSGNGGNNSGSNGNNSGNGSSSGTNNGNNASSGSSGTTVTSGDLGKGHQYRPMATIPLKDYEKNMIKDQGVTLYLYMFVDGTTEFDDGSTTALMYFVLENGSDDIKIPLENPYGDFTQKELVTFTENAFSGKYESKYMEVKCGSKRIPTAVLSGDTSTMSSILVPGQSATVMLLCKMPKDWTSVTVKYVMPYDTKKYANFIVYPSDSMND